VVHTGKEGLVGERQQRRKRLRPEQKWQVFLEASRRNSTDAEVCRQWGITPWQLRAIRERAKDGAKEAFGKGPGRPRKDPVMAELEHDLARTSRALKELAIENTLLRGKVDGA
jgi:transposase-like protein